MAQHPITQPITEGQVEHLENMFREMLPGAALTKQGAQRIIGRGDQLRKALEKLAAAPFKLTSVPFALSFDPESTRQSVAQALLAPRRDRREDLNWCIWKDTERQLQPFLGWIDTETYSQGTYAFVQFAEMPSHTEALRSLEAEGYRPANFRELLEALTAYDQNRIKLPLQYYNTISQGHFLAIREMYAADERLWVPGSRVFYHDANSGQYLFAYDWARLMQRQWQEYCHILVRLVDEG
ncbi:MAG: hypothetical protein U1A16_03320 [Patescibacteria group bacterium]|nr:hypothetical protein [Patescibacteria group bacterium]